MPQTFQFFQRALIALLDSQNIRSGLENLFSVMHSTFSVDAMTFNQCLHDEKKIFVHYVVTREGLFDVRHFVPMNDADMAHMQYAEQSPSAVLTSENSHTSDLLRVHSQMLHQYVPYKERGYMASILHAEDRVVGHLVLLGREPGCFTNADAQLMATIVPACSLAMSTMFELQEISLQNVRMKGEQKRLERELSVFTRSGLIGAQGGLAEVVEAVRKLADQSSSVLILGETGTGKELVADAIQRNSRRSAKAFIKVNCGAISDMLLDSELFGHERGAFTGAIHTRRGRFEQADGGTLFLDEVGELSPQAQVRLLRVLQDGTFERIGGHHPISVNVRIIAATNRDLPGMCREGRFRFDLFHRLNVFPIHIPPLRKRREDIPLLLHHLAERTAKKLGLTPPPVSLGSMDRLMQYPWPGNVRELENLVERCMICFPGRPLDVAALLPMPATQEQMTTTSTLEAVDRLPEDAVSLKILVEEILEKLLPQFVQRHTAPLLPHTRPSDEEMAVCIREALRICKGRVSGPHGAAELLGVNMHTLRSRMRKLGILGKRNAENGDRNLRQDESCKQEQ